MSEFEQLVVGSLLDDSAKLSQIDLSPDEFTVAPYAEIYSAIVSMVENKQAVDLFTVDDELKRRTGREWTQMLAALQHRSYSGPNIKAYAKAIKDRNVENTARFIAEDMIERLPAEGMACVDSAIAQLMALGKANKSTLYSMKDALKDAFGYLDTMMENKGALVGIPTGLSDLDDMTSGLHDTDFVVVGARPAMGKTALLLNFSLNSGVRNLICSTEQPALQVALRMLSTVSRVDSRNIRVADLEDHQWSSITRAATELQAKSIWIDERSQPNISQIVRQARRLKVEKNIDAVYVDYIQRIDGSDPRAPRREQVDEVCKGLKTLAREIEVPVVALSQVSRDVEKRSNKRPTMADMSDSSSIEKESDLIMTLYRDDVYYEDSDEKGIAEINIEKNRHGPLAMIKTAWEGKFFKFRDLSLGGGY